MKQGNHNSSLHNRIIIENDLSVLLVDDNKVNQFLGKRILKQLGIAKVEVASDGIAAFELIQAKHFDVLLTDVEMPGMNGYELCEAIRKLPTPVSGVVIIALTANVSETEKQKALLLGMNDYLNKPYTPQELLSVLFGNVKTKKGFISEDFFHTPVDDTNPVTRIYTLFNNNREDALGLLSMLSKQIPELIEEMKKGILQNDWDQTFQSSHKLKSSIKLFGDERITACIFEISENSRARISLERVPEAFERFVVDAEGILMMINRELESHQ